MVLGQIDSQLELNENKLSSATYYPILVNEIGNTPVNH